MIDTKAILAEVKANQAKLEGCSKHNFHRIEEKLFSKFRCANCGGTVDVQAVRWYSLGQKHGT